MKGLGNSLQTCTEADFLFLLPSLTFTFTPLGILMILTSILLIQMTSDTGRLSSGRIYLWNCLTVTWLQWEETVARSEGVLPGIHVLGPSPYKDTKRFTGKAKALNVCCLVCPSSFLIICCNFWLHLLCKPNKFGRWNFLISCRGKLVQILLLAFWYKVLMFSLSLEHL